MKVRITDIQHFCLHDGPGIRTTVFLKGCSLNCPWCANPECISSKIENGFGYDISLEELETEILKDVPFYKTGGGVTFSGGEPLLQIKNLEPLLKKLDINICFETALFVPPKSVKLAIKYADEFIVDIKILDKKTCKRIIENDINIYLNNLQILDLDKVTFRIPICEYTLNDTELIIDLLKKYPPKNVEIFIIHNLANDKYK